MTNNLFEEKSNLKYSYLVGKIAADKYGKKLSRVYKLERLPDKITKKLEPHLLLLVEGLFKKSVIIPIDTSKVIKTETQYVWLDITKEEFDLEVKKARAIKKHRWEEISAKDQWEPSMGLAYSATGPYLQPRPKVKKRKK